MAYLYQIVGYDGADRPKRDTVKSGPRLVHGQIGRLSGQQRGYRDQYFFVGKDNRESGTKMEQICFLKTINQIFSYC